METRCSDALPNFRLSETSWNKCKKKTLWSRKECWHIKFPKWTIYRIAQHPLGWSKFRNKSAQKCNFKACLTFLHFLKPEIQLQWTKDMFSSSWYLVHRPATSRNAIFYVAILGAQSTTDKCELEKSVGYLDYTYLAFSFSSTLKPAVRRMLSQWVHLLVSW